MKESSRSVLCEERDMMSLFYKENNPSKYLDVLLEYYSSSFARKSSSRSSRLNSSSLGMYVIYFEAKI